MTEVVHRPIRSWLFAPGDSERKMTKAANSDADMVIFDLEDAVSTENKAEARQIVHDFLIANDALRERIFVRVNALNSTHALEDLARVMPARPGGIMLAKTASREEAEDLNKYLAALEVANGIERGSTPMVLQVAETAGSMFHCGDFAGTPRLMAMTWGAEDLADAIGALSNTYEDGQYQFTYELARSLCLLGAAEAGVAAIDTIHTDFRDLESLAKRASQMRSQGFRGMLAIHPAQVPVINEAFTPSDDELAEAREIVALFEANPGAGAVAHNGSMLDRPNLSRALQAIAQAKA